MDECGNNPLIYNVDTSMDELTEIPEWAGYRVARAGAVWSDHTNRWKKQFLNNRGYLSVSLTGPDGENKVLQVHSLVALTFHGPRPNGNVVRHLNGNPLDNSADNLTYGTQAQNVRDTVRHGRHHQKVKTHCPKGHPYEGENLFTDSRGHRRCRTCKREDMRARRAK